MKEYFEEDLPQRSKAWHDFRSLRGMASEAACVMNDPVYEPKTWLQLFELKKGRSKPVRQTKAMAWGTKNEPVARRSFIEAKKMDLVPSTVVDTFRISVTDSAGKRDFEFELGASLDGRSPEGVPVEIKCPEKGIESQLWKQLERAHAVISREEMPSHIYWQCQHQLLVTNESTMLLYIWTPQTNATFVVQRDDDACIALTNNWGEFLELLVNDVPPKPAKQDPIDRSNDDAWSAVAAQCKALNDKIKTDSDKLESLKHQLEQLSQVYDGNKTNRTSKANGVSVYVRTNSARVNWQALVNAQLPNLSDTETEEYRTQPKTPETWVVKLA
jgi:putative phage-type endonuclease